MQSANTRNISTSNRSAVSTAQKTPSKPGASHYQFTPPATGKISYATLLKQHVTRMLQTAGHSWNSTEHHELFDPILDARDALITRIPVQYRRSLQRRFIGRGWQYGYFGLLFVALIALPVGIVIRHDLQSQRYQLSAAVKKLVGEPVVSLDKQLIFDSKASAYQYNPGAANGIKASAGASGDNSATIGGSKYYGVNLAQAATKGQTFTDAQTKLSFSLVPQFGSLNGKRVNGHIVYPIDAGQAVYTLKDNGLKEDVVLSTPTAGATLKYKLQLPDTLQAKPEADGSIGIYSANPSLFGNISYGSNTDQATVQKARINGQKTNLVFQIPAPIITESGKVSSAGKASFKLDGNELTVVASNLQDLSYPISIDPSVVIQSANSFTSGNDEDGNSVIATSSVTRALLSGGAVNGLATDPATNTWATTTSIPAGSSSAQVGISVINGYAYYINSNQSWSATINATTGAIGTWTPQANLPSGVSLYVGGTATYNGYLYVANGNNSTSIAYAKPVNGVISSWNTAAQNYTTVSVRPVIYNGYFYIVGGCTGSIQATCNDVATTQYAPINADGSLGSFTVSSTQLASARAGVQTFTANGYLYAVGGTTSSGTSISAGNLSESYYSKLQPNGDIGAWKSTTALPQISSNGGVAVVQGYAYIYGGSNNQTAAATTYYAPIYAGGGLGAWQSTSAMGTATYRAASFFANGYIYNAGGCGSTCGSVYTTTQYAKIDPPGMLGPIQTTTNFDTVGATQMAAVVTNGYLYLLGGTSNGVNTPSTTVRYAAINAATGTVGSWTTTNSFSIARDSANAIAYNGTIYMIGGSGSDATSCPSNYCNIIETASVNVSTGALTWSGTKYTYSTAGTGSQVGGRDKLAATTLNGYLYVVGGTYSNNSIDAKEVDYATVNNDGTLGTFKPTTATTTTGKGMHSGGAYAWGGRLYAVGNRGGTTTEYATPQANGDITSWATTGSDSTAGNGLQEYAVAMEKGMLYLSGGTDLSNGAGKIYQATIQVDGTVSAWTLSSQTLSSSRQTHVMLGYAGNLYVLGGKDNGVTPTYYKATEYYLVNNGGNGNTGSWTTNGTATSTARYDAGSVVSNGYLYILGGINNGTFYKTVEYAAFNPDGSLGSFTPTSSFLGSTQLTTFTTYNGYIYKLGGGANSTLYNDVQYAAICTGTNTTTAFTTNCAPGSTAGSLTNWAYTASNANNGSTQSGGFNTARTLHVAAAYNGYLYIAGGCTNSTGLSNNCIGLGTSVESAPINANGTVGTWTTVGNFNTGRYGLSGTIYNGYLYIAGGCTGYDGINNTCNTFNSTVQYAQVSNGNLASNSGCGTTWCFASNFNTAGLWYTNGLSGSNGYLYLQPSVTGPGPASSANVQFAPVSTNGMPGQWISGSTSYTTTRYGATSTTYNGNTYIIGGCSSTSLNCSGNVLSDVQYAGQQAQARVAHYSRLIDLASTVNGNSGGDAQITRYRFLGSGTAQPNGQGPLSFCWSNATTNAPTFNAPSCNNAAFGNLIAAKGFGRYGFAYLTLDDSPSTTFPESVSPTSVTELDAYFHAAPARRLRGGQTFTDQGVTGGTTNQLDTEGQ